MSQATKLSSFLLKLCWIGVVAPSATGILKNHVILAYEYGYTSVPQSLESYGRALVERFTSPGAAAFPQPNELTFKNNFLVITYIMFRSMCPPATLKYLDKSPLTTGLVTGESFIINTESTKTDKPPNWLAPFAMSTMINFWDSGADVDVGKEGTPSFPLAIHGEIAIRDGYNSGAYPPPESTVDTWEPTNVESQKRLDAWSLGLTLMVHLFHPATDDNQTYYFKDDHSKDENTGVFDPKVNLPYLSRLFGGYGPGTPLFEQYVRPLIVDVLLPLLRHDPTKRMLIEDAFNMLTHQMLQFLIGGVGGYDAKIQPTISELDGLILRDMAMFDDVDPAIIVPPPAVAQPPKIDKPVIVAASPPKTDKPAVAGDVPAQKRRVSPEQQPAKALKSATSVGVTDEPPPKAAAPQPAKALKSATSVAAATPVTESIRSALAKLHIKSAFDFVPYMTMASGSPWPDTFEECQTIFTKMVGIRLVDVNPAMLQGISSENIVSMGRWGGARPDQYMAPIPYPLPPGAPSSAGLKQMILTVIPFLGPNNQFNAAALLPYLKMACDRKGLGLGLFQQSPSRFAFHSDREPTVLPNCANASKPINCLYWVGICTAPIYGLGADGSAGKLILATGGAGQISMLEVKKQVARRMSDTCLRDAPLPRYRSTFCC